MRIGGVGFELERQKAKKGAENEINKWRIEHCEKRVLQVKQRGPPRFFGRTEREHPLHEGENDEQNRERDQASDDVTAGIAQD